ncbi:MAG: TonB-dependent receptor [Bacteroidia bacterium]|nr:TonB-dependent receptor [Bacteroidia bacterium]
MLLVLTGLLAASLALHAQTVSVTGTVQSEQNEPLAGVRVTVKGSATGAITNEEGVFRLNAARDAVLVFSIIGYEKQEVALDGRARLEIRLVSGSLALDEVVVIGYGERRQRDLTGSISSVNSEALSKTVAMAPELAMQGRLAGVYVSTPGGSPTARPQVRIRGVSTFGNADPLYVVDGIPLYEQYGGLDGVGGSAAADLRGTINILSLINPSDIESVSVLKDASAAAIYGVRAANGVILITTRRGRSGRPRVEFNGSYGIQNALNRFEVLNTAEYKEFYLEAFEANPDAVQTDPYKSLDTIPVNDFYDWQDYLINKNAVVRDASVRISGGSEATTYYLSIGQSYQDAIVKGNDLNRYSFAANINSQVSKYVKTGVTYRLTYAKANDAAFSTGQPANLERMATSTPWQPIEDPNNPYGYAPVARVTFKDNPNYDPDRLSSGPPREIDQVALLWGPNTRSNLFGMQRTNTAQYDYTRQMGTAFVQLDPFKGFSIKGTLSGDYTYQWRHGFSDVNSYLFNQTPGNPFAIGDGTSKGSYSERHIRTLNLVREISAQYARQFGGHSLDVLLNRMDQRITYEYIGATNDQINLIGEQFMTIQGSPNRYNNVGGFRDEQTLIGYLARLSYNYKYKYYLDATLRRDGSSKFAPENRWGIFPSVAVAWRISEEAFLQSVGVINDLKIRAGYGQLGNQETRAFAFLSSVSTAPSYAYGSGNGNGVGNVNFGATLPDFPNRDLSWERAITYNIGADAVLLRNRLTVTVEYYNRLTDGILQAAALPGNVGNLNQPVFNIASVRNSGVEVQAGWTQQIGSLNLNVSGNVTTVKNRVEKLFRDEPFGGEYGRIEVGMPLFYLWGYQTGGIFQNSGEIEIWRAGTEDRINGGYQQQPGDMYFVDVNGDPLNPGEGPDPNPDSVINQYDRTFIGNTIPGFYYGFNLGAEWKGFDLTVFFQGVGDVEQVNTARISGEGMSYSNLPNQWATVRERWTPQNPSETMPRAIINDPNGNTRFSDRWVESAAFIRLRNVTLGYTLPASMLEAMGGFAQMVRIYCMGSNLFTITRWQGIDPEQNNRDGQVIPPVRAITGGLSLSF